MSRSSGPVGRSGEEHEKLQGLVLMIFLFFQSELNVKKGLQTASLFRDFDFFLKEPQHRNKQLSVLFILYKKAFPTSL